MDRTKNLYKNRHLADCTFKFRDGRNLEANKILLSFYSPVFESMFFGDMAEGQSSKPVVEIVDADYEIFDKFLMYIYIKKIEMEDVVEAEDIFYLARKYEVLDLEYVCLKYIRDGLNIETVCSAYEIARLFDDKELEEISLKIIRDRTVPVLLSKAFLNCDVTTLVAIMSQRTLNITSEIQLFNALEVWNGFNGYALVKDTRAIQKVQFLRMTHQDFVSGPMQSDLLSNDDKLKIISCLTMKGTYDMPFGFTDKTDRICLDRSDENIFRKIKEIRESLNPPFFECPHYTEASINHIIMKCSEYNEGREELYNDLGRRGQKVYEYARDRLNQTLKIIEEKDDKKSLKILCDFIKSHNIDLKYLFKLHPNEIEAIDKIDKILLWPGL